MDGQQGVCLHGLILAMGQQPDTLTGNGQTVFQRLEAAIEGCLDEIEREGEETDPQ